MAVPSMLSGNDVSTLISIMEFVSSCSAYNYLEIGSYLGASLQWHLTNNKCIKAVSIDKRSTDKILDERHNDYAYNVSTQDMINALTSNGLPIDKLFTIDGTVDDIPHTDHYDLIFIDAEHTNSAVLYDGKKCISAMKDDSVLMFHDDWIVYKGIEKLEEHLISVGRSYRKFKMPGCDVTVLVFGTLIDPFETIFNERSVPWSQLVDGAEKRLAREIENNQGRRR